MKRKRKTRKTFTDAQKRGLVNEVIVLLNQGTKLTNARIEVARKHKTTPISLARWSKDISNTVVRKSNGKILTPYNKAVMPTSRVHITGVDLHVPGKGTIKLDTELLTHISKLAGYTG